jgi:hypothetical protein
MILSSEVGTLRSSIYDIIFRRGYSTFIYIWYYLQTWVLYVHLYMILSSDVGTLRSSIYENTERYYIASSETTYTCNRNIAIYSKRYITMSDIKQYTMWMLHPHPLPPNNMLMHIYEHKSNINPGYQSFQLLSTRNDINFLLLQQRQQIKTSDNHHVTVQLQQHNLIWNWCCTSTSVKKYK